MATAVVKTETKMVETEVSEKVIRLELTELEAKVLGSMTSLIAGNEDTTYRGVTDRIGNELGRIVGWVSGYTYFTRGRSLHALDFKGDDK